MQYQRILLLILAIFPSLCHAHVKWFVEEHHAFTSARYVFDSLFAFILLGAFLFLAAAGIMQRQAKYSARTHGFLNAPISRYWMKNPTQHINTLLKFSLGILLLANLVQGHFIAPNFVADGSAVKYAITQALLILLLIVNVSWFAIALFIFALSLFVFFPIANAIDYAPELIALSIALFFTSPAYAQGEVQLGFFGKNYRWQRYAFSTAIVQLGLGIQLIILTFHDKLLHPGFGLAFLHDYPIFNFLNYFGWHSFTNAHFVFGAGLAELCFGLLLVTNIAPRISSLLIVSIFTLTGFVLGPEELLGHVPIIAMALVLLLTPIASTVAPEEKLDSELLVD
ncbi:hypothetical protein [Cellvibrio sp. NN19]|uniref:hypothetical protein n=1 Tax=Cellvibrio chitinivorans TaxID=3102792 RepID=UPI002B407E75|nr:hypothetical protein [Cellvibrio sp. NN19]